MIVVDTSAAVALILEEAGGDTLAAKLATSPQRVLSPVSYSELIMVLSRTFSQPKVVADEFMRDMRITFLAIDEVHAQLAVRAFLLFGKGRHPARLNLGDCFSYAAAMALDAPLLFVGGDFNKTDIKIA